MEPEISVIVPLYNVEAYLERCVRSILQQTFQSFELILVDDGSADRSPEICDALQKSDPRVRVIHQRNAGPGPARNSGIDAAAGKYILFVDADDYCGDKHLERLYTAAENWGADVCIGGLSTVYKNGTIRSESHIKTARVFAGVEVNTVLLDTVGALPRSRWDSRYGPSACARLYRRDLIEKHGIRFMTQRPELSEDIIFNVAVFRHAECVAAITDASYYYDCGNVGSGSKRHRSDRFLIDMDLYRLLDEVLTEIFPEKEHTLYLQRTIIMRTGFDITQEVLYHDHVDRTYPMRDSLRTILRDEELQRILRSYPWREMPVLRAILVGTMRYQRCGMLIWLIRLQQRLMLSSQNI